MIRFVDLGKQIAEDHNDPDWPREFSFYDTLEARFLVLGNQQIFDSCDDLMEQLDEYETAYIKRIMGLIPAWVPRGKGTTVR